MENFLLIVTKADNIPIVGMIFIFTFFTWFALRMARKNDKLIKADRKDEIIKEMRK